MFRKQSEKASCRPKRLITGQGGERRSCRQEGHNRRGDFLGIQDGIVKGNLLVTGGGGGGKSRMADAELRCAVCADGSFSLKTFFFWSCCGGRVVVVFQFLLSGCNAATLKLFTQYAHIWDI